ncbi:MAG TPA: 30S ribosomal protein S8 [Candidatus Paceibacterota bacterium]
MLITDPIGDFITRLKNASMVKKASMSVPFSNVKHAVALTLKKNGYVGEITESGEGVKKMITVALLYGADGFARIHDVKRVSKPGRRLYTSVKHIHPIKYGKGLMILSTPRGILTDSEARANRVGGETLFTIW